MSPQEWLASQKSAAQPRPMSPEEWLAAQKSRAGRPPVEEEESIFRQVADVPLSIAKGATQGVRMIADAFGAGSETSKTIRGAEDYIAGLMSAQSKNDSKEVARIMKEAEDKGVLENVKAGLKAFTVAPVDLLTSALGNAAPAIAATVLATLSAPASVPAALVATGTALGVGATMGAGTVKGTIYEETKNALKEAGVKDEKRIEEVALKAQEYGGKNLDMILAGAGLGAIASRFGAEKQLVGALTKKITANVAAKEAAETAAVKTGTGAAVKKVLAESGKEAVPEFAQAAQEKLAENIALQRTGEAEGIKALAETPTMRGVVGAATLEALAGAALGGTLSTREALQIARGRGATDEELQQLQAKIDAEQLAKQKEDLQGKAAAVNVEDVATRTQELAKEPATAGDVLTAATQAAQEKLAEEATPEQKVAEASTKVDTLTARVDELTDEYIAAGESPDQAKIKAAAQAAEEEKNDQETEQAIQELAEVQAEAGKEAEDAAKAIEQGGGESVPIPSEPVGGVPTEGVEPSVTAGMERPAPSAEPTVRGEEVPSGAVESLEDLLNQDRKIFASLQDALKRQDIVNEAIAKLEKAPSIKVPDETPPSFSGTYVERAKQAADYAANRLKLLEAAEKQDAEKNRLLKESSKIDRETIAITDKLFEVRRKINSIETKETPSVTTPPEAQQAKEEGAAAPAEGTEVAKPATAAKPAGVPKAAAPQVTIINQYSGKNTDGQNTKDLVLSNGETVTITNVGEGRKPKWVRRVNGEEEVLGTNLKDAFLKVRSDAVPTGPAPKRGPKPRLTEEEKETRAIESGMRTEELNAVENIILSTKKLKGSDRPGLATMLDLFLGPRPESKASMQQYHDTFMKGIEGQFANIGNPETKTEALNDYITKRVLPVLEELYRIGTDPKYANTRIRDLAMSNFERGPSNIKKGIIARAERRKEAVKPVEKEEVVSEEPIVTPQAPTGPAPKIVVKKKRTIEKPEVLKQARGARSVTDVNINTAINNVRAPVIKDPTAKRAAGAIVASTRDGSFENELAKRLRTVVGDTPFVIVEPNDPNTKLRKAFEKLEARGIYSANEDLLGDSAPKGIIYVAGAKYGNTKQGVNNRTALHELLHAGSYAKIRQGQAILETDEKSTDPRAVAVRKLEDLRNAVRVKYEREGYSKLTPGLQKILSEDGGSALYSLDEFFAYGMTDPEFQAYLKTINVGRIQKPESAFSAFVKIIRAVLGISKDFESALANLIEVSDTLLTTEPKADVADAQAKIEILSQKQDVQTAADVQVKYANDVINTPRSQGPSVSLLDQAIANGMDLSSQAELAGAVAEGAMSGARKHILGAFTPSQLAKLAVEKVPALTRVVDLGRKFNAKRQQYLDYMKKVMKPWLKLQRNDREQSQLLATIMHLATVNGIDPSIPGKDRLASTPQSDTLDDLWEKLGEPAREIYIDVRDYYAKQYEKYKELLNKRIEMMKISDEEKTKFMDLLKKQFESDKVAQPYFPLMRYGENWLRVGKGKDMEFYMFESASERNRFAIRRAKEMGKPLKDLYADGTLKRGDQLKNMMEESFADTTKLKEVLAAVDKLGIDTDKASIKDEIYQMYLLTLPDKSFRKQFIHRKNTAGFSADALRNFGTAGFRMANQLAKMEYQPQIVNTLDEARESIKDDPDASKYRPYIEEVAADFDAAVNPKNENSILNFAANGLSTLNFFYYMSSISSALTNMTSLPVFGYPTLLAEFGKTPKGVKDVHTELVRFMNVYKEVGFRRKDGDKTEYVMPSIRNALTNADEIKAYDEFAADNLFSFNRSMDLLNIVKSPSQEATNPNILKVPVQKATDFVSNIFSMTEQLPREMMAMAAYRLGRSQDLSHDEATKKALVLTHDAMYDYSMFDTPRYFRGPVGRTIFQFKKFSQNTAFYLTTNFLQIFKGADPTIRKQAATRFFGTLGMTGMFAGLTGMPLYTVMSTVMEKVLSAFGDDDDDEDSAIFQIRKYGYDLWFKKWLSENFGANVATYVAMGPVTGLTGADFNSRVKLNDLFFQDWEFKGLLGPSFGMFENAQRAYDRFKEGQTERAIETMMPAFIRQGLKAYRFSEEGVKTPKGYEVVAKEDLDWMDIAMQSIGYAPIKVSMKQSENFKLKKLEQEREEERTELLKRSVYARRGISDEDPDDIDKDIDKFNSKFPNRRITPATIMQSDQARRRQERAVDQGLYIANPMNRRELLELRAKE